MALAAALRALADAMVLNAASTAGVPDQVAQAIPAVVDRGAQTVATKAKRRVSQYQRRWGANLKQLKAKHPRTAHATLMRRAHRMTRKEMKK